MDYPPDSSNSAFVCGRDLGSERHSCFVVNVESEFDALAVNSDFCRWFVCEVCTFSQNFDNEAEQGFFSGTLN